ncbi:hypothetical protein BC477_14770 [Clavibacter michiganensis subsp. michiganensis]|uniref:Uncharacterized protein n=1 Tax=Clavibacter michiganensis subsp. michiganensis TaxID=33013 RepID=A0A251XEF6_CLAMM|nr:hypothetical protein BC477_14770 [Clavibacter michiganensis subsp. michiganensis]OUE00644.1 hypothetical protein CMMCAS07_17230 [Clavibacter michiganensis subsp. michiganensis]
MRRELGAISASSSRVKGELSAEESVKKTWPTRSSVRPVRSRATRVFSKVGGSGESAIARTSARCSAIPAWNAGRK